MIESLDVLAFGAHPDDIELTCGGTLILMVNQGHRVGAADLTRGELGTRGSEAIRTQETAEANRILKLAVRENAGIPDGNIEVSQEHLLKIIRLIRRHRPRLVLAPYWEERHPDHVNASNLVAQAAFYAGLPKIDTGQQSFRPFRVLFYVGRIGVHPSFVVDVSETFEAKMRALRCYRSQFYDAAQKDASEEPQTEPQTMISTSYAQETVDTLFRYYGAMIGARYGEPFVMREALEVSDPVAHFRRFPDSKQAHFFPER